LWALRALEGGEVLGFTGLSIPFHFPAVLPAVEVGWRLRRDAWGHGYATEAARPAIAHGFAEAGLEEVISLIHCDNERSVAGARCGPPGASPARRAWESAPGPCSGACRAAPAAAWCRAGRSPRRRPARQRPSRCRPPAGPAPAASPAETAAAAPAAPRARTR